MTSAGSGSDRLELECQVRFIQHAKAEYENATADAIDLWIAGFRAGTAARTHLRSMERLQELLAELKDECRIAPGQLESVIDGSGR